jgi:hypothetical protein
VGDDDLLVTYLLEIRHGPRLHNPPATA